MREVLVLSLVTAAISFTATETRIFRPPREWVDLGLLVDGQGWEVRSSQPTRRENDRETRKRTMNSNMLQDPHGDQP